MKVWDVFTGLAKAVVFGAVLSLIACHRGFNSRAGAEGVGRAATEAFVYSFIAILVLDFFLAMLGELAVRSSGRRGRRIQQPTGEAMRSRSSSCTGDP